MHKAVEYLLNERYLWEWGGEKLTPYKENIFDLFKRVSKKIASAELYFNPEITVEELQKINTDFYSVMEKSYFIPSSPQLFNVMRGVNMESKEWFETIYKPIEETTLDDYKKLHGFINHKAAYGSCYSMGDIEDSIENIYSSLKEQAMIFRAAGGYGANFSKIRAHGATVKSINGESSGPLGFMRLFNLNTEEIALHTKLKRGANNFILNYNHPDIENFISKKKVKCILMRIVM